jgi:thiamine-monophosphate kinase
MALSEFAVIQRYFTRTDAERADVVLGIGDDAALLRVREGHEVVIGVGLLTEGQHFAPDSPPESVGHRALAIALIRLAAAAAEPAWYTLALTLPSPNEDWLEAFSRGLRELADRYHLALVGGDTTHGPLQVVVHAQGLVPRGQSLQARGARPGDLVYVTGELGLAGLALLVRQGEARLGARDRQAAECRLERPEPAARAGLALRGIASAAAGVPDGLAAGLATILRANGVGATLQAGLLPVPALLSERLELAGGWIVPLTAPGDLELCFTVPPERQAILEGRFAELGLPCAWIGTIDRAPGLRCLREDGTDIAPSDP